MITDHLILLLKTIVLFEHAKQAQVTHGPLVVKSTWRRCEVAYKTAKMNASFFFEPPKYKEPHENYIERAS